MRRAVSLCGVFLAIFLSGQAWSADDGFVLRFGVGHATPSGGLTESASFSGMDLGNGTMLAFDGSIAIEPQEAPVLALGFEYRVNGRFGIDASLLRANTDLDGRLNGTYWINDSMTGELIETGPLNATQEVGDLDVTPLTVAANFHLTPKSKADFYLAPVVGYMFYGDLDLMGEKASVKSAFAWGAAAGVDIPVGKGRWLINAALRYLESEVELDEPGAVGGASDMSLFAIQVGAGYRF